MRSFRFLTLVLVTLVMGCPPPQPPLSPPQANPTRVGYQEQVDVTATNLPPSEELDALLAGEPAHGLMKNGVRMAVVPFEVLGDAGKAWMGEAVSEVVSSGLSRVDGVWVLEREHLNLITDQLKGGTDGDLSGVAQKAKLLRAEYLVVGKVVPEGSGYRALVTPVRVKDAVKLPAVTIDLTEDDFSQADTKAAKVLAEVGLKGAAVDRGTPLSPQALKKATKARELLRKGELVQAQPLFDEALKNPSSEWRLEGDYLRLMNMLGMVDWVEARAKNLLNRMPKGAASTCPRAKVLVEMADANDDINVARDAVRAAASCGESGLQVEALVVYAFLAGDIDHPRAGVALDRARTLLAETPNPYLQCLVDFRRYYWEAEKGLDVGPTGLSKSYLGLADACEEAGNLSYAALSLANAGAHAWSSTAALAHYRRARELSTRVGGRRLTGVRIKLAGALRRAGRIEEADATLLAGMKARLARVVALHAGGLPDPESRLPQDLLGRIGVAAPGDATPPDAMSALRLKAHRKALSQLLHAWAKRTANATNAKAAARQAEQYRALARLLAEEQTPLDDPSAEHARRLEAEGGITLEELEAATDAPLIGSGVNPGGVTSVLWSWFWALDRKTDPQQTERVMTAYKKTAGWLRRPRASANALRLEARFLRERERGREAVPVLDSALQLISDHPPHTARFTEERVLALAQEDPDAAIAAAEQRPAQARKASPHQWVWSISTWGYYASGRDDDGVAAAKKMLREAADELQRTDDWEHAALALRRLASLHNQAAHQSGTAQAVQLMTERVKILDRLRDPQRSLLARLDLLNELSNIYAQRFGGRSKSAMRKSPVVTTLVEEVDRYARKLAVKGNHREAVRVLTKLHSDIPRLDEMSKRGLAWAENFRGSKEYAPLTAELYVGLAGGTLRRADKNKYWKLAHERFVQAGQLSRAVDQLSSLLGWTRNVADAEEVVEQCMSLAKKDDVLQLACVEGIGKFFMYQEVKPNDANAVRSYAHRGEALIPLADRRRSGERRMEFRTFVAVLGAIANDVALANRVHADMKKLLARRNPYEYAQHLSRLAPTFRNSDPKRGLALYEEFLRSPAPSAFYKMGGYPKAALLARAAGDTKREQELLETGLKKLGRFPTMTRAYAMYDARRAQEVDDPKALGKALGEAVALYEKHLPTYRTKIRRLRLWQALAHHAAKDAFAAIREVEALVEEIEKGEVPFDLPCADAEVLEHAAAMLFSVGRCPRAEKLEELAKKRRRQCKPGGQCVPTPIPGATWCTTSDIFEAENGCRESYAPDIDSWTL